MKTPAKNGILPPRLPGSLPLAAPEPLADRADWSQVRLAGSDFSSAQAADVLFDTVHLKRNLFLQSRLERLRLFDCRLEGCEGSGAIWDKAHLRRVELASCRLLGISLAEATFEDVRFSECNLEGAFFGSGVFKAARFEGCSLRSASFEGANLAGVVFERCDLSGADLRGALLTGADFSTAVIDGMKAGPAEMQGAIINAAQAVQVVGLLGVKVKTD